MAIVEKEPTPIPDTFSEDMRTLVGSLLCKDQFKRPNVFRILDTPYLKKFLDLYEQNILKPYELHPRDDLDPDLALQDFESKQLKKVLNEEQRVRQALEDNFVKAFKIMKLESQMDDDSFGANDRATTKQVIEDSFMGNDRTDEDSFAANDRTVGVKNQP